MDGDRPAGPLLELEFTAGSLYALRQAAVEHAAAAGMGQARATDVMLAVHELAANAVRHGAGRGRLRMWCQDGALVCQVRDLLDTRGPPTYLACDEAPGDYVFWSL